MKMIAAIGQLLLRLTLGVGFLIPVMDRLGFLGPPGSGATWGDWKHFVDYTNKLIPFASWQIANIMSVIATIAELVFGLLGVSEICYTLFRGKLTTYFAGKEMQQML